MKNGWYCETCAQNENAAENVQGADQERFEIEEAICETTGDLKKKGVLRGQTHSVQGSSKVWTTSHDQILSVAVKTEIGTPAPVSTQA